jgi:hypothetical protein
MHCSSKNDYQLPWRAKILLGHATAIDTLLDENDFLADVFPQQGIGP